MKLIILGKPNLVIEHDRAKQIKDDLFDGSDLNQLIKDHSLKHKQQNDGQYLKLCSTKN